MSEPNKTWFRVAVDAKAPPVAPADVYVFDEIGLWGVRAADFIAAIRPLKDAKRPLKVHVNSPGGDPFDAAAIYNELKQYPADVTVFVSGVAASAASVLALGGNKLVMAENGIYFIHLPSAGKYGTATTHRQLADLLETVTESLITAYERKTGKPRDEIRAAMEKETAYDAKAAKEFGFADEIAEPVAVAASVDISSITATGIKDLHQSFAPVLAARATTEPGEDPTHEETAPMPEPVKAEMTLDRLRADHQELVANIESAAVKNATQGILDGERARIKAIRDAAEDFQAELADELIDKGTSELEALRTLNADRKERGVKGIAALKDADKAVAVKPNGEPKAQAKTAADPDAEFEALVQAHQSAKGCGYGDALKAVRATNPELWAKTTDGGDN